MHGDTEPRKHGDADDAAPRGHLADELPLAKEIDEGIGAIASALQQLAAYQSRLAQP